jgi:hypothetical protein
LPSFRRTLQRKNMMAANYRHIGGDENRLGRHYADFRGFGSRPSLPINHLHCENRRTQGRIGQVGLTRRGARRASGTFAARNGVTSARAQILWRSTASDIVKKFSVASAVRAFSAKLSGSWTSHRASAKPTEPVRATSHPCEPRSWSH